jgi:hypothetical protein
MRNNPLNIKEWLPSWGVSVFTLWCVLWMSGVGFMIYRNLQTPLYHYKTIISVEPAVKDSVAGKYMETRDSKTNLTEFSFKPDSENPIENNRYVPGFKIVDPVPYNHFKGENIRLGGLLMLVLSLLLALLFWGT